MIHPTVYVFAYKSKEAMHVKLIYDLENPFFSTLPRPVKYRAVQDHPKYILSGAWNVFDMCLRCVGDISQ